MPTNESQRITLVPGDITWKTSSNTHPHTIIKHTEGYETMFKKKKKMDGLHGSECTGDWSPHELGKKVHLLTSRLIPLQI